MKGWEGRYRSAKSIVALAFRTDEEEAFTAALLVAEFMETIRGFFTK